MYIALNYVIIYDGTLFSDTDDWQWVIKMADQGIQNKGNVGFYHNFQTTVKCT